MTDNIEQLQRAVELAQEQLATAQRALEVAQNDPDAPMRKGETYWLIDGVGNVESDSWDDHRYDRARLEIGNVFRTRERAEGELRYRKIMTRLRRLVRVSGESGNDTSWSIRKEDRAFVADWWSESMSDLGGCYFATEQAARDAIAEIGEDDLNFVRGWR